MTKDLDAIPNGEEANSEPPITENMRGGLELLWKAAKYARSAGLDQWNFAVEVNELREAGLTSSDLRWLVAKGHVAHACEIDAETNENRSFKDHHRFRFTSDSCFVLTSLGIQFVRIGILEPLRAASARGVNQLDLPLANPVAHTVTDGSNDQDRTPRWDSVRRELWLDHTLVKRFRVPAPRQEIVLTVFQEEDWPARIDDPLPPQPAIDSKRQLHATISSLNRHQKGSLIRFSGDGSGCGILWELVANGERLS